MTRAVFRKLIMNSAILFVLTLTVLLSMNLITNQRLETEKQAGLQKTLGIVLVADNYRKIPAKTDPDTQTGVQSAYAGYDSEGILLGYVIDAMDITETGELLARMSFSPDGETLLSLAVLDDPEDVSLGKEDAAVRAAEFTKQFKGIRLPVALVSDLPDENTNSTVFPPVAGLRDGTYREQQEKQDQAGYKDFVEIVVSGGRITEVIWDAIQTDGGKNRAQASVEGEYILDDNKVIWAEQAYAMQNKLIDVQDPAKIAIKSDGTTEVVPSVTVNVNAFVTLANKCIEDSKNGISADTATAAPAATPGDGTAATPTPLPTPTPSSAVGSSDPTKDTAISFSGSEDGVVKNDQSNTLSDTIDGFPVSSIKTKISDAAGAQQSSRVVVSTVNQAYLFLTEYLKGGQ